MSPEPTVPVEVAITLPYPIRLPEGRFGAVVLSHRSTGDGLPQARTALRFDAPVRLDEDDRNRLREKQANELLRATNSLLRWYRVATRQIDVVELTRARASPFEFTSDGAPWGGEHPLWFADEDLTSSKSAEEIGRIVREGLDSKREPAVADLFLFDAHAAREAGRFREAVLFCWSTIDATFSQGYEGFLNSALANEWKDGREALTTGGGSNRVSMRVAMSAVLFLLTGRSLHREPDELWDKLTKSYKKRNNIIHQGDQADESDADLALDVARRVVSLMRDDFALRPELASSR